jgi:hypothetical protein
MMMLGAIVMQAHKQSCCHSRNNEQNYTKHSSVHPSGVHVQRVDTIYLLVDDG